MKMKASVSNAAVSILQILTDFFIPVHPGKSSPCNNNPLPGGAFLLVPPLTPRQTSSRTEGRKPAFPNYGCNGGLNGT